MTWRTHRLPSIIATPFATLARYKSLENRRLARAAQNWASRYAVLSQRRGALMDGFHDFLGHHFEEALVGIAELAGLGIENAESTERVTGGGAQRSAGVEAKSALLQEGILGEAAIAGEILN